MSLSKAIEHWQYLLGPEQVIQGDSIGAAYTGDTGGAIRKILAVLHLKDCLQVSGVMRIAHENRVPVYPVSTGKNWGYGSALPVRDGCVIVDLSGLKKIIHFDSELGVVTVEPGVTQGMLAKFLETNRHPFLVPVTGAGPTCSLLSNALERGFGVTPYVDHFGAVTDLEAVLPDGSMYRTALREAGGEDLARLFKWGIGPYSNGIFSQSGFGIVTRMSIVLARRPQCVKVCVFSIQNDNLLELAVLRVRDIMRRIHGTVGAINLMNQHRVLSMTAPYPVELTDANGVIGRQDIESLGKKYQIFPWTGFCTLYGTHRMINAAQEEIKNALSDVACQSIFLTPERAKMLWKFSKMIPGNFGRKLQRSSAILTKSLDLVNGYPNETDMPLVYWRKPMTKQGDNLNPAIDGCGLLWYTPLVPMRAHDVRSYVNMIHDILPRYGIEPLITLTTLSERLFDSTVPLVFDRSNPKSVQDAQACYQELLHTGRAKGWFPYRVGVNTMPALQKMQVLSRAFHDRLQTSLDPHDLMAPGRYR